MKLEKYAELMIFNSTLTAPATYHQRTYLNYDEFQNMFKQKYKFLIKFHRGNISEVLHDLIKETEDKMIAILNFSSRMPKVDRIDVIQEYCEQNNIQKELMTNQTPVMSLFEFIKHQLRRMYIRYYFESKILPGISAEFKNNCDRLLGVQSQNHVQYSFGYLASVKKNILIDYKNDELNWIRMANTQTSKDKIDEVFGTKAARMQNNKLKVFLPSAYYKNNKYDPYYNKPPLEYIDIFTTDGTAAPYLQLTCDPIDLAFAENLTPLIKELQELEILDTTEILV